MGTSYKVWIQIERINEERGIYEDIELPDCAGKFGLEEEAREMVLRLLTCAGVGNQGDSDQVPLDFLRAAGRGGVA